MADAALPRSTRRAVDDAALAHVRRRLAAAREAPWLHAETARRMAERLPIFRTPPRRVIDWYGKTLPAMRCWPAPVRRPNASGWIHWTC
jgi:hypothetical protein